ncbi:N-acetylmuramoyl-L-alanine amidase [Legionella sp. km772]|uniref:N-acetylmuramoyl-L-alanine amidase n=1 Tax=Legionella sp. km772 TaxID=2498111 RepID=UPI000F8F2530|nr:N-acetylmuramoyl-L-alanine amidase [Legionella sp. km772]RUR04579.1 hypothetical protein ELY15_15325 [Legionella sp. km772]
MPKLILFLLIGLNLIVFAVFGQPIQHKELAFKSSQLTKKIDPGYVLIYNTEILKVPLKGPRPFLAFACKVLFAKESPKPLLEIRYLLNRSTWSPWQAIKEDNLEEIKSKEFFSELIFLEKNIKFIQLRLKVSKAELNELNLFFISPGKTDLKTLNLIKAMTASDRLTPGRPNFVSRKSWGCPQPEHSGAQLLTNVTHLVIHHSGANNFSKDYPAVVRSYWTYHVKVHKWSDIGYNWLVDENGVLYKGRAWRNATQENVQGAHNTGRNGNTVGICFIGDYEKYIPKSKGLEKLTAIMAFLCNKYGIDPTSQSYHAALSRINDNISGHQQSGGGGTHCPGTHLSSLLDELRQNTRNQIINSCYAHKLVV